MSSRGESQNWTVQGEGQRGVVGPVAGSMRYASTSDDWQPTALQGFWVKSLFEDSARGEKTLLMKVDPGAWSPMHSHEGEQEQIFVLEGTFYDQDGTFETGDYCCRAPGAPHTAGSVGGALVLLIYTRE